MTQVLPALVWWGGERGRRSLRAQTLPQVAAPWSGPCEQQPATALALPEAAAPRDAVFGPRPAMVRFLPHALLAAVRQGGACGQRPATALALPETAARRDAACEPRPAIARSLDGAPGRRSATARALPAEAQQGGANGQRPAMGRALPGAGQQDAVWKGGMKPRRATARTLHGMGQGGKRRRQAMVPVLSAATVRSRLLWTNQAHAAPTWRTARIVGCALPFGRLPHRRRNRGRRGPDRRSPTRCPSNTGVGKTPHDHKPR